MQRYSKALAAFVTSAVALVVALAANGAVDSHIADLVAALVPFLTALGVYAAPPNTTA